PNPHAAEAEDGRGAHSAAAAPLPQPPDPLRNLWWQWRPRPAASAGGALAAEGATPADAARAGAPAAASTAMPAAGDISPADLAALRVAYFSAEFGVAESLPIYAGGLGVLAGDHLKSASDLGVPLVGVGLLYR